MTSPEETVHFVFRESQCFPEVQLEETLRFGGNKMNCFPRDQSLSDLLYSTFVGNSALIPSDVMYFALLPAQRLLAGNGFIVRCHVTSK